MSELYEDPTDEPVVQAPDTVVVVSNFPDADSARNVAASLVQDRHAACANVMSPCHSIYNWEGQLRQEMEVPVWLKTTDQAVARLIERLKQLHPHEVPEVLVLNPNHVAPDYGQWISRQVG